MFRRYVEILNEFLCNFTKTLKKHHFFRFGDFVMEKSKYCLTMSKNNLKNRDMWDKKVNFNDIIAILNVNKTKKATENCFFDRFFCVEKRKKQRFSQSARGFCAIFLLDFPRQMC